MANKIILNKFISHLNNAMSAFNLKKKINFLILKEKIKENLNKKEKSYSIKKKKKKKKEQKNLNPKEQ